MKNNTKKLVMSALVAAIYAATTYALAPYSFGPVQARLSEALTVLPYFSTLSIWGLFVGCLIGNLMSPIGPLDIIFGSLATLGAAYITYLIGKSNIRYKRALAPLPPVLVNAVVIGLLIGYSTATSPIPHMLQVGLGQLIPCYLIGLPLLTFIDKSAQLKKYFL